MQDSWDQMTEVLDKQSNIILEIKEQSKVQGSHEIKDHNDIFASPRNKITRKRIYKVSIAGVGKNKFSLL